MQSQTNDKMKDEENGEEGEQEGLVRLVTIL